MPTIVRESVLKHPVLVDSRLVRKGVPPDDRLVRLGEHAGEIREELARPVDLPRFDVAMESEGGLANLTRHHDLLECRVPRAFSDAVHGALHLPSTGLYRGQ